MALEGGMKGGEEPKLLDYGLAESDLPLAVIVGGGAMAMAIAYRLSSRYKLLIADRDEGVLRERLPPMASAGGHVAGLVCDVTSPDDVAELARQARDFGPPTRLVHVVGLSPSMGSWRDILAVNLVGAERVATAFEQDMPTGSAALFISSIAWVSASLSKDQLALIDDPLQADFIERLEATLAESPNSGLAYSVSKLGVIRLCRRKAFLWGRRGVRILSLSPGMIQSPMGDREFANQPIKRALFESSPIPREGSMTEIVNAADFLLSADASFITGTDLLVDGGVTARALNDR